MLHPAVADALNGRLAGIDKRAAEFQEEARRIEYEAGNLNARLIATSDKVVALQAERRAVLDALELLQNLSDAGCTSDDPTDHQGDTCPVHEAIADAVSACYRCGVTTWTVVDRNIDGNPGAVGATCDGCGLYFTTDVGL